MCCVLDSTDCATLHCPLYLCPHTCCLFVYLFVCLPLFLSVMCCLPCLFPFQIVSVVDRQQANIKSNCIHCIRRGLGRRLRSSLLLNSSPRCDPPCNTLFNILISILLLALVGTLPLFN